MEIKMSFTSRTYLHRRKWTIEQDQWQRADSMPLPEEGSDLSWSIEWTTEYFGPTSHSWIITWQLIRTRFPFDSRTGSRIKWARMETSYQIRSIKICTNKPFGYLAKSQTIPTHPVVIDRARWSNPDPCPPSKLDPRLKSRFWFCQWAAAAAAK